MRLLAGCKQFQLQRNHYEIILRSYLRNVNTLSLVSILFHRAPNQLSVHPFHSSSTNYKVLNTTTNLNNISDSINYNEKDIKVRDVPGSSLCVKNLPVSLEPNELKACFENFGEIIDYSIKRLPTGKPTRIGFIYFRNSESASKAIEKLNGALKIQNHEVTLTLAKVLSKNLDYKTPRNEIYIGNLSNFTLLNKRRQLKGIFSNYGEIDSMFIPVDKQGFPRTFCFITFQNIHDAIEAKDSLNNHIIDGSQCSIQFPDPNYSKSFGNSSNILLDALSINRDFKKSNIKVLIPNSPNYYAHSHRFDIDSPKRDDQLKSDLPKTWTLFIQNLPRDISKKDIIMNLENYDTDFTEQNIISYQENIKNGTCIVGYMSLDKAQKLKEILNGVAFGDKKIKINYKNPFNKFKNRSQLEKILSKIYIENFPIETTKDEVIEYLQQFGKIDELRIFRNITEDEPQLQCYVGFSSFGEASKAMESVNDTDFNGVPLCASYTTYESSDEFMKSRSKIIDNNSSLSSGKSPNHGVFVHFPGPNLIISITDKLKLQRAFGNYGEVENIDIPIDESTDKSKGYASVTYKNPEDATEAIKNLNNSRLLGRRVKLSALQRPLRSPNYKSLNHKNQLER